VDSTRGPVTPDSDDDASFEFACVADYDNIYIAFRVKDDVIISGDVESECDLYQDDSIEFYLDNCYERASVYDGDDAQITIGADSIGQTDQSAFTLGGCNAPLKGADTGTTVLSTRTADGWAGEISIPLRIEGENGWNLQPLAGQVVGFDAHYNDDDGDGERDSKLIWSAEDVYDDASWSDPTEFAELQFCEVGGGPVGDGGVELTDGGYVVTYDGGDMSADGGM
jgi:hypothetical protein